MTSQTMLAEIDKSPINRTITHAHRIIFAFQQLGEKEKLQLFLGKIQGNGLVLWYSQTLQVPCGVLAEQSHQHVSVSASFAKFDRGECQSGEGESGDQETVVSGIINDRGVK